MGAILSQESRHRGRKLLNVELNLVPFIDLLSCLIAFLLITAVWTRISAVEGYTPNVVLDEREAEHRNVLPLSVVIMDGGALELRHHSTTIAIPPVSGHLNGKAFDERLRAFRRESDRKEVRIRAWDEVPYEELVRALDILAENGWTVPLILSTT